MQQRGQRAPCETLASVHVLRLSDQITGIASKIASKRVSQELIVLLNRERQTSGLTDLFF